MKALWKGIKMYNCDISAMFYIQLQVSIHQYLFWKSKKKDLALNYVWVEGQEA